MHDIFTCIVTQKLNHIMKCWIVCVIIIFLWFCRRFSSWLQLMSALMLQITFKCIEVNMSAICNYWSESKIQLIYSRKNSNRNSLIRAWLSLIKEKNANDKTVSMRKFRKIYILTNTTEHVHFCVCVMISIHESWDYRLLSSFPRTEFICLIKQEIANTLDNLHMLTKIYSKDLVYMVLVFLHFQWIGVWNCSSIL